MAESFRMSESAMLREWPNMGLRVPQRKVPELVMEGNRLKNTKVSWGWKCTAITLVHTQDRLR